MWIYQKLAGGASAFGSWKALDEHECEVVRAQGCPWCGKGTLHRSDYPRKPRGLPPEAEGDFQRRLSLCCDREGCRRRVTPPSIRFFSRRVYAAVAVVLAGALAGGLSPARIRKLQGWLGVSKRTLERWVTWWREEFSATAFFRVASGRLAAPVLASTLPQGLLRRFTGRTTAQKLQQFLEFLSPISTTSYPLEAGWVKGM